MTTAGEVIEDELRRLHPCNCHEGFSHRNLIDPNCVGHEIRGDSADILAALERHGFTVMSSSPQEVQGPDTVPGGS